MSIDANDSAGGRLGERPGCEWRLGSYDDIIANRLESACSGPGTVVSTLHVLIYMIFTTILCSYYYYPLFQMNKLKHAEVKGHIQGHAASKLEPELNPSHQAQGSAQIHYAILPLICYKRDI